MKTLFYALIYSIAGTLNTCNIVYGQIKEPDYDLIIENIASFTDEDFDIEGLNETLISLYHKPINLNTADRVDLQAIPFLSEEEITTILKFREQFGTFISNYELYLIADLDSSRIDMILPFIQISNTKYEKDTIPFFTNFIRTSQKSVMIRYGRLLQSQKGYQRKTYLNSSGTGQYFTGSADHIYGRIELHEPNDFDMGITFEKDAGEAFFFSSALKNYGFDHYAGYFRLQNRGLLNDLTVGDFQVHFGEGLVWGRGYGNKGSETIGGVRNRYNGPRPYQGASETGFLRGICLSLGNRSFSMTALASRKPKDAIIMMDSMNQETPDDGKYYVSSILSTGYHRTPHEILAKNQLIEYTFGSNIQYQVKNKNMTLGTTFSCSYSDYPIQKKISYYNQFSFEGSINYSGSVYYNFYRGKLNVFGELAHTIGNGSAVIQGVIANILSNFETSIHVRYFGQNYYSVYGKSFSEYDGNNNETGIYWGLKIIPFHRFEIRGYYDMFKSDWPRYNISTPSLGHELFLNFRYQSSSKMYYNVAFKTESKYRNDSQNKVPVYTIAKGTKQNYQFTFCINPSKCLKIKTRLQGNSYSFLGNRTIGYCLAQDLTWETGKFKVNNRIAYFLAEDYNNRQYMYEHDVLYSYSMPAYFGHGLRLYVVVKYTPVHNLDIWLKTSQYHYFGIEEIGTGPAAISGNKKTEIKCQVRIKF